MARLVFGMNQSLDGPNARLVGDDLEGAIRQLKAERDGEIEVAGPALAQSPVDPR